MNRYTIRRTRVITDRFAVKAWTLDEAFEALAEAGWSDEADEAIEQLAEVTDMVESSVEAIEYFEAHVRR